MNSIINLHCTHKKCDANRYAYCKGAVGFITDFDKIKFLVQNKYSMILHTGLDVNSGFICRRRCYKRLQDIKTKLQTITGNVIQSVALDTEAAALPSTSLSSTSVSSKVLPQSQIKTASGKRIVLVTVKKDESAKEAVSSGILNLMSSV